MNVSPEVKSFGIGKPIEPIAIIKNPQAPINIPIPIFLGADGSFPLFAIAPNKFMNTGVRTTTKKGLNC